MRISLFASLVALFFLVDLIVTLSMSYLDEFCMCRYSSSCSESHREMQSVM